MTCIVGIAQGGRVWLGGDNAGFIGGTILQHNNGKVFRSGEFVMGCAGNRRFGELARYAFKPPTIKIKDVERYMVTTFIDALREALRGKGYLSSTNGQEGADRENGDGMLVGVRGGLYFVGCDFTASMVADGMFSIGCGQDYALGALYATPAAEPEVRIGVALAAAERYSDGVVGPFHVVSTPDRTGKADAALMKAWEAMHAAKKRGAKPNRAPRSKKARQASSQGGRGKAAARDPKGRFAR